MYIDLTYFGTAAGVVLLSWLCGVFVGLVKDCFFIVRDKPQ